MARPHCSAVASLVGAMRRLSGTTSRRKKKPAAAGGNQPNVEADWSRKCSGCGATPVVPVTGLCGPCTFGEADTAGGEW